MTSDNIIKFINSKAFKKITIVSAILLLFISGVIVINPEPFLKIGYPGVFIFTAIGGGSLIVFPLSLHMNIFLLAFSAAFGMAMNDSLAWFIGNRGRNVFDRSKKAEKIENSIKKYGSIAILFWSLLPFPYDLIGLVAGYLGMKYPSYVVPTFLGKFIRFLMIGLGMVNIYQ